MVPPAMTAAAWHQALPGLALDGILELAQLPPHELAARALYGQPFGFTRAHLAALRYEAQEGELPPPPGSPSMFSVADMVALQAAGVPMFTGEDVQEEQRVRIRAVTNLTDEALARIEALLPPDETARPWVPPWPIPPALTPEAWARTLPGLALDGVPELAQLPPHELAARALHGQPFGFTRMQLAALRFLCICAEDADWRELGDYEGECSRYLEEWHRNFAVSVPGAIECMAALLPPEGA
jgi:hypothetical protein